MEETGRRGWGENEEEGEGEEEEGGVMVEGGVVGKGEQYSIDIEGIAWQRSRWQDRSRQRP